MHHARIGWAMWLVMVLARPALAVDPPAPRSPKEALRVFNDFIGSWKGTGTPEGTREEKRRRGFWTESLSWTWQFKGDQTWLQVVFDQGRYFTRGELRYVPDQDRFQLTLRTTAKETLVFTGPLKDHQLALEREDGATKETQRLVFSLLHENRFLYRYEVKPPNRSLFTKLYQVGATKEGVPFAGGDGKPECVVSGGRGTIPVTYEGETYYVCCTGCRDVFKDDPEKFVKEYRERKAKDKKER
jgi:hypothetical protein